jgi:DNA-binding MarR family transcriptional regulator
MKERFQTFTVLISKISRNIKKIKNQEMAEYGLRSVHVTCLYYLYAQESLTATELCELCEEDKATISRALDFLEEKGFLLPQPSKKYKSPLLLSEKGIEAGKKIAEKIDFVLEEICIDLTEAERDEFYRSLTIISDSLELCTGGIQQAKQIKTQDKKEKP